MWELVSFLASLIAFGLLMTVGYSVVLYLPIWLEDKANSNPPDNRKTYNAGLEKRMELLEGKVRAMTSDTSTI